MNADPCNSPCSRRHFLSAVCAGCASGFSLLSAGASEAPTPTKTYRPKIRVVFCEAANTQPIWPNIGYDFSARRGQILNALSTGQPDLEFLPASVVDDPKQATAVLQGNSEVEGYLVCVQGLGWSNDLAKLCETGKPTLLVDNLFGGSGHFLLQLHGILASGLPVDWVSSSDERDLLASVGNFRLLRQGKAASEVAAAFRATRRSRTAGNGDWTCKEDQVITRSFDEALAQLKKTKLLVVGGGWGGDAFARAAQALTGVSFVPLDFKELAAAYEAASAPDARTFAAQWAKAAQEVVEPSPQDLEKSGLMYVAMKGLLGRYGAHGISVNCLGGFYSGQLPAYPCLGFSQFNNDGQVGGCEGDQASALTMTLISTLTGRPGFISDPVIDTSKGAIIYTHCVATTRPFGPRGAANAFRIRSHSEDRKGAAIQSLLPAGYMTTTLQMNPESRQILMHQAKTIGNNPSDMACRTKLEAVVKGDLEKLTQNWRMGWHRVTFYGDLKEPVLELSDRLKLELIEEA